MEFPRQHPHPDFKGSYDDGKKIANNKCPNCNSKNFFETVSTETCPDCGWFFDYWEKGGNEVVKLYNELKYQEYIEECQRIEYDYEE